MSKRETLVFNVPVNAGHDEGRIVREGDPTGAVVEHIVIDTQRMADRLLSLGVITGAQHLAATILRDLWDRAGLAVGRVRARSLEVSVGGERTVVSDDLAWKAYLQAMQQCGQWRLPLKFVVVDDGSPDDYGHRYRCDGIASLSIALDRLVAHFEKAGLIARGQRRNPGVHHPGRIAWAKTLNAKLTPEERRAKAQRASQARWAKRADGTS